MAARQDLFHTPFWGIKNSCVVAVLWSPMRRLQKLKFQFLKGCNHISSQYMTSKAMLHCVNFRFQIQGDSSQVSIVLAYLSSLYMKHSWNPSTRWEPTWVEFVWCILTLGKWKTTPQKHAIKFGGDFGKKWNSKIFLEIWFPTAKILGHGCPYYT